MLEIEQSFLTDFIAQSFGLPIGFENENFTPGENEPHVLLTTFANDETALDLAHTNETDGFFQFQLRYPSGAGAIIPKQKRAQIFAVYPIGRALTYGGQKVHVTGTHGMRGINEDGWYRLTCAIFYEAWLPR